MDVFQFILLIVIISTVGKVLIEVGGPMVNKLGDVASALASRGGDDNGPSALDSEVVEELERRLARIEDRLDFLEQLRAPDSHRRLGGGLERGAGRRDTMEPGTEPQAGRSETSEQTAGETP